MTESATLAKRITHIARLASSKAGNPAYLLTFADGTQARTAEDAADAYTVGNPGIREGCTVALRYGPRRGSRGIITHISPITEETNR